MMSLFRRFAKSWVAVLLMGLLILSFGIWGISDVFHHRVSDAVIKAGSREVSREDFKSIFERQLRQLSEQNGGQPVPAREAVAQGLDRYVLQQLAQQEAFAEMIRRAGVAPSAALVVDRLRKIPAFFNPISGAFDETAYKQRLAENGLTPAKFEAEIKDEIAEQQFSSGLATGLRLPRTYAAVIAGFSMQNRDADYFVVDQRAVAMPTPPTDAQLLQYIKSNETRFRVPELRDLSLVRFSAAALATTLTADPAQVQKRFDFEKNRLAVPEKRSFVQIPAKDAAQASQIAARLAKGEAPTAIAAALGAKPIAYADAAKASVADPKVADAVFALTQPNQVTGPIQGEFGLSVAQLQSIAPAKTADLEAVRPQIEAQVKADQAQEKVYDQVQKYDDAHGSGAKMDDAAAKAGVKVYPLPIVTADGRGPNGQQIPALTQKMLQDAFSLPQGGETDIVDLGRGEYYALRVNKITPAAVPPLEKLRPFVSQEWMQREIVTRVQAHADGLAERLKKGETLEAIAAGAQVQHAVGINRANAGQHQELGQAFLGKMFEAKPNEGFTAPVMTGVAVARLTTVRNASAQDIGRLAEQGRPQMTVQMIRGELGDMVRSAARERIKPQIDEALARQAIGVAPEEIPASGAPAKAAGKAK